MNKWIIGARVKTLPAAVAPVLIGTAYATQISWLNALLAMLVALFLQIAVNYSNDYSDGIKGTDSNRFILVDRCWSYFYLGSLGIHRW